MSSGDGVRPRCFVTRRLPGTALDRLAEVCDVDVWEQRLPPPADVLRERAADADALITLLTDRVDAELLDAAPRLRAVANYAVGYDNIDVPLLVGRGIPVGNTPGVLTEATADLAFTLLLALARRLPEAEANVRTGDWLTWEPSALLGRSVHGATLGIIGYGRIGRAVGRRAEGFDMTVLWHDVHGGVPLDELLERSDFVTLHCNLTEDTRHLIGADALARMKPTACLVNTARGPIVDPSALADALHRGEIFAAGLDVTEPEPLPADHPLLDAPNLIVLPHVASATEDARAAMADLAVDNVLAALDGRPMPNPVTE